MSQIEVSPGGVGFIRTPLITVPGVPTSAKRQQWVTGRSRGSALDSRDASSSRRRTSGRTD